MRGGESVDNRVEAGVQWYQGKNKTRFQFGTDCNMTEMENATHHDCTVG